MVKCISRRQTWARLPGKRAQTSLEQPRAPAQPDTRSPTLTAARHCGLREALTSVLEFLGLQIHFFSVRICYLLRCLGRPPSRGDTETNGSNRHLRTGEAAFPGPIGKILKQLLLIVIKSLLSFLHFVVNQ